MDKRTREEKEANRLNFDDTFKDLPPTSNRGVSLWEELQHCNTFYPSCCQLSWREMVNDWLYDNGGAFSFCGAMETYKIAHRVLDGYKYRGICLSCLEDLMGGGVK